MDIILKTYNNVFYERADVRVKDWLLMSSPWTIAGIISVYLLLIKVCLPSYMRDRKPVNLRTVIKWYNLMQIVANAVVTWGIMTSGWTTTYHFGCMLPDYSTKPEPLRMLRFLWWTIILKLVELIETAFFILRKKESQASFLHIYHHCSSLIIVWVAVKYIGDILAQILQKHAAWSQLYMLVFKSISFIPVKIVKKHVGFVIPSSTEGGITSFSPMLNNAIHVMMYSYYLFSTEGSPAVKRFLVKYKKWITIIQMIQFTIMLIYSSQVFLPSCPAPLSIAIMYFPNVIFVYFMFYKFYVKNYVHKNMNGNGLKSK